MNELKSKIIEAIDRSKDELLALNKNIHHNPELGFEEHKAVLWLTTLLKSHGFEIHQPIGGLDTAFKAVYKGKVDGPRVAFLAEYDALPGVGHGCGHNIIATSAAGAAIGLSKVMENLGGQVILLGTPAEEGGGGKITLLETGEFNDVDYSLMMHPGTKSLIGRGALAATGVTIEFYGKAAHSAGPEEGINALQGLITVFNSMDSLRAVLKDQTRINGIITHGGVASNIIPDYARGEFTVRAKTREYLEFVVEKIEDMVEAVKILTGAQAVMTVDKVYAERYPNMVIAETFKKNMEFLGEEMGYPSENETMGSSDIGNVSMKMPAIHPYLKIAESTINTHSKEFTIAAISERGNEVAIKAAKGLAMTGFDILNDLDLREKIKNEFDEKVALK